MTIKETNLFENFTHVSEQPPSRSRLNQHSTLVSPKQTLFAYNTDRDGIFLYPKTGQALTCDVILLVSYGQ